MGFKKRLYHTIRLSLIRNSVDRGKYLREKNLLYKTGVKVSFMPRKLPLYPKLISLNDNVRIGSNVTFITHDGVHRMLNIKNKKNIFQEKIGCILVEENVFIGSNSIIMYDVRVGTNSIIAAGSVVTKDVPKGSVVGGNPAKLLGTIKDYIEKNKTKRYCYPDKLRPKNQNINQELIDLMWKKFEEKGR